MALIDLQSYIEEGITQDPPVYANYYFQQEKVSYTLAKLIPGHFYSFAVVNRVPNDMVPNLSETRTPAQLKQYNLQRPYYDNRPVVLSLGNDGNGGEIVLNLKIIPPKLRSVIIRRYLGVVKDRLPNFYENGEPVPIRERLAGPNRNSIAPFFSVTAPFLSKLTGINLSFGLNKYQREQMADVGLIDWNDVSKIELIDYRNDPTIAVKTPVAVLLNEFGK
jgi:hypothetical protein